MSARLLCWFVIASCLSLATAGTRAQNPATSIEAIHNQWKSRQQKVRSFRFEWGGEHTVAKGALKTRSNLSIPEEHTTYNTSFVLVVDGKRMRHCRDFIHIRTSSAGLQKSDWVINEKGFRSFLPREVQPYPEGTISEASFDPGWIDDPQLLPLLMTYRPFHILNTIVEEFPDRFMVVPGTYKIGDRPCVWLKEKATEPGQRITNLWVDPARDYVVLRLSQTDHGVTAWQMSLSEYQRAEEIWVPVKWSVIVQNPEGSMNTSTSCSVQSFRINQPIDPKEFELMFPVGTWIVDREKSEVYILQEGGRKRRITAEELAGGATYEQLINTQPYMALSNQTTRDSQWVYLGVPLALVSFGAIVIWAVKKRVRVRKEGPCK
jgi:hypothetical protein